MLLSEKLRLASCLSGDVYAPWRHVLPKGTRPDLRRVPIAVHGTGLYCQGCTQRCLTVSCEGLTPAKVATGTGFLSLSCYQRVETGAPSPALFGKGMNLKTERGQ